MCERKDDPETEQDKAANEKPDVVNDSASLPVFQRPGLKEWKEAMCCESERCC